jgi:hypothetical protein
MERALIAHQTLKMLYINVSSCEKLDPQSTGITLNTESGQIR